ncbi:MAG TPA: hypothetical protein VF041_20765 [Gemmatimonadaceae bacterium]
MRPFPHAGGRSPLAIAVVLAAAMLGCRGDGSGPRFSVAIPSVDGGGPLDGRMLVMLSTDSTREPRFQIEDADATQQLFGVDVNGATAGDRVIVGDGAIGYPRRRLADVPPGDYWVQALLHRYETFHRADGHTVELPMDRGEGQQWNRAPGNLYSRARKIHVDAKAGTIALQLDKVIPPIPDEPDTKYVKHVRIRSERLTRFWGRPMYIGALVLLPEGWDTHPNVRYPLAVYQGHFEREVSGWRESPPDSSLPPAKRDSIAVHCPNGHEGDACTRFGYPRVMQELGWDFYKQWTGPGFPRVILVTLQHANPYYDDSYAVNSENLGPYGDAIMYELIPFIERTYRGIGAGWARGTYGGSTGGWEALAVQVMYPDEYNGAYANCPDPIDFHRFTTVDIYADSNAYYSSGPWKRTPRPGERDYLGRTRATVEQVNHRELALGTHSRSGGQFDIWEAVFSPVGPDGYPRRIWNKETGVIDHDVASYWRDHYDLVHIMRRDWASLGPKLRGKIHLNVGLSDNYFLNDAVYLADDFLSSATHPPADATVDYGMRDEHCWSGDHSTANAFSRLTYHSRFIRALARHWVRTAPEGADVRGWRY